MISNTKQPWGNPGSAKQLWLQCMYLCFTAAVQLQRQETVKFLWDLLFFFLTTASRYTAQLVSIRFYLRICKYLWLDQALNTWSKILFSSKSVLLELIKEQAQTQWPGGCSWLWQAVPVSNLPGAGLLTEAGQPCSQRSPSHRAAESIGPGRLSHHCSWPVAIIIALK